MSFHFRKNLFLYYRLFFITLFILLGLTCVGIVISANAFGLEIIQTTNAFEKGALHTTLLVMSALGFIVAASMVFLLRERRHARPDRRTQAKPLDFADRRENIDRRTL